MRIAALIAGLVLCPGIVRTPAARASSYVRLCSPYQTLSAAALERDREAALDGRGSVDEAQALLEVRLHVPLGAIVRIMTDSYRPPGARVDERRAVGEIRDGGTTRYAAVVVDASDRFVRMEPVATAAFVAIVARMHTFAANALLEDLLAGDAVVPRLGCARLVEVRLSGAVRDELEAAFTRVPEADPDFVARVRAAYAVYAASRLPPLSRATIDRLGMHPAIARIYHDDDGVGTAYDIVRFGAGPLRTYLLVEDDGTRLVLPAADVCLVGDEVCARSAAAR